MPLHVPCQWRPPWFSNSSNGRPDQEPLFTVWMDRIQYEMD